MVLCLFGRYFLISCSCNEIYHWPSQALLFFRSDCQSPNRLITANPAYLPHINEVHCSDPLWMGVKANFCLNQGIQFVKIM